MNLRLAMSTVVVCAITSAGASAEEKRKTMNATMQDEPLLHFPESGVARVPYQRGVNHVLVEAVDTTGAKHVFAVDTGAGISVVTPHFLETAAAQKSDADAPEAAVGSHGALPGTPTVHELRDLRFGDLRLERAAAIYLDISKNLDAELGLEIHGILGYNVLSSVVTLVDYAAQEVVFLAQKTDAESATFGRPDHAVRFRLRMGALIEVSGSLNGEEKMPFIFDLGSPYTFLNARAAKGSGIDFRQESDKDVAKACGVDAETVIETGRAETLRFATLSFAEPEIRAIDLPVFATLGLADAKAGVLGNDLLAGHLVAIDYAASELRIWRP